MVNAQSQTQLVSALAADACLQSHLWAGKCEFIVTVMLLKVSWWQIFCRAYCCVYWLAGEKSVCLKDGLSTRKNQPQQEQMFTAAVCVSPTVTLENSVEEVGTLPNLLFITKSVYCSIYYVL